MGTSWKDITHVRNRGYGRDVEVLVERETAVLLRTSIEDWHRDAWFPKAVLHPWSDGTATVNSDFLQACSKMKRNFIGLPPRKGERYGRSMMEPQWTSRPVPVGIRPVDDPRRGKPLFIPEPKGEIIGTCFKRMETKRKRPSRKPRALKAPETQCPLFDAATEELSSRPKRGRIVG